MSVRATMGHSFMKSVLAVACVVLVVLAACGAERTPQWNGPPVGIVRLDLVDGERFSWRGTGSRPLATTLWYPAAAGSEETLVSFPQDRPIFVGGYAARGADVASNGPYPLVLMSHGTGGSALQMMWLGRALAAAGFIVAAVDHHGNTAAEPSFDARGFRMPWHRALDITAVLDQLLSDSRWGQLIDSDRISAVGFSLGGFAVTALAGGRIDLDRLAAFCAGEARDATCDAQPEFPEADQEFLAMLKADPLLADDVARSGSDFSDSRIDSFVMLAPAPVQAFTDESLRALTQPILSIVGEADDIAPAVTNGGRLAELATTATYRTVFGANHYVFLNTCTPRGRRFIPVCNDGPRPREEVHREVIDVVVVHLNK